LLKAGVNVEVIGCISLSDLVLAEALFKLNITNYPEKANCYDGLGDLYLATGDKLKVIESFKKTLSLKAIPETKQKLEKILKGKRLIEV
jgi:uncharacterized protein